MPVHSTSTSVGSKSTRTQRGTRFRPPVSLRQELKVSFSETDGPVTCHHATGLDSMLEAGSFPTSFANPDAYLADMETDALAHVVNCSN